MSNERNASSNSTSPQENAMFLDILHEAPLFGHRKPRSIVGGVFYCSILASYAILAAAASWLFQPIENFVLPLLCSCDVVLLIVTGIFQQYHVYQVQKIRLQGYYSFSQKLKHIVRLPFAITAYGENCCNDACHGLETLHQYSFHLCHTQLICRIIMLVEAVCSGFFMSVYVGCVHQYNSLDSQPDVLKSLYSPLQPSSPLEDLRYHDVGQLSDQQMALLQYQRENLHFLSEEILRLQECLSKYEGSNDGSTPQVDLAHLLAARDQELRTVSAESELRLARSLMVERDAEVQRVRTTNNQYVEENERLRAILGEWSTRAAKCISVYDSPEEKSEDRRRLFSAEEREEDDLGSCSSSSIERNTDVSGESSLDNEDSTETEVQSELKGPLDTMDALEEVLPMRRGMSKFYNGKSKSFTSLADAAAASSVKDFAKPDNPYNRKRKNLLAHSFLLDKNRINPLRNSGSEISKRLANSNRSTVALGTTTSSSDFNSISSSPSSCLPPLHPQCRKSTTIRSSSPTTRLNPSCRCFSLSDLQFVAAATPNIAGLAVHSGNKDNKLR
ncbi:hypothetical protein CRYUN_Cryun02cG0025200 [Craigia yunnanensis]